MHVSLPGQRLQSEQVYDHNHRFDGKGHKKNEFRTAPIVIGKNVRIPINSLVTSGRELNITPLYD